MPRNLTSGDNWLKKACRKYVELCESLFIKHIIRPVVFLLPPSIVATSATRTGLRQDVVDLLGSDIGGYLNTSALVLLIGSYLYVVVVKAIYACIRSYSKPARELQVNDLIAIFKALTIVVMDKCKRMSLNAQVALKQVSINPQTTFLEITRPDQQIPLLVSSVTSVFDYIDDSNANFRSGLMRVIDGKPYEWYAFEPITSPPRTSIEELSHPTSTISRCIKYKKIVVVDDIQRELRISRDNKRNYVRGSTQENDQGSQLCYPIIHSATRKIEYVLCVSGDKAGCLSRKHSELYAWIIEHFAMRIAMEHSLLILKEKSCAQATIAT